MNNAGSQRGRIARPGDPERRAAHDSGQSGADPPLPSASFPIRLNKYIASCGASSRRGADELIADGRVSVDGELVTSLGYVLSAPADVCVDGRPIAPARRVYIAMNKPRGVLSAVRDERCATVIGLLPTRYARLGLFPVGRLDLDSEGLIILTNDGDLAQSILHPSKGVRRTYIAHLASELSDAALDAWRAGVDIGERHARPISVEREDGRLDVCRVVLGEGFKREIREMARAIGSRVTRLKRIGFGEFFLEKLPTGAFCEYNYDEISRMIFFGGMV